MVFCSSVTTRTSTFSLRNEGTCSCVVKKIFMSCLLACCNKIYEIVNVDGMAIAAAAGKKGDTYKQKIKINECDDVCASIMPP